MIFDLEEFKIDFSNRNYSFINFIFPIPRLLDGKLILLTSFLSMIKVKKTISSKQAKFLMKKVFFLYPFSAHVIVISVVSYRV